ncbi:hypothetical protein CHUAL_000111 [Chamberlinius hualienensis]
MVDQLTVNVDNSKETVQSTQNIIQQLVNCMREVDPLFNQIYTKTVYIGSFYENLKIKQADEFDINFELQLPFKETQYQAQYSGQPTGFAKYKLLKKLTKHPVDVILYRQIFADDFHLSRVKLNNWIQDVIDRAMVHGNAKFHQIHQVIRHIPPATTLKICFEKSFQVSVDLVPVIRLEHIPKSARQTFLQLPIQFRESCLVPQPAPKHSPESELLLRISMPKLEKELSQIDGHFKSLIRLFKAIRDQNGWKSEFPSYLIKTFFMWQIDVVPDNYWTNQSIDQLFLKSCEEFVETLQSGKIANYFFPNLNLLPCVQPEVVDQMIRKFSSMANNPLKELACRI